MTDLDRLMKGMQAPGAVDLAALKATASGREQLKNAADDLLRQNGLLCPCGERVTDEGIVIYSLATGMIPTPQGPQMGAQLVTTTAHSKECPVYAQLLEKEETIAVRDLTPVEWLKAEEGEKEETSADG